jgi:NADH dehydrogenase I D subunit
MSDYIKGIGTAPGLDVESVEEGDLGTKKMTINFGPQHPATHGTLRNIMTIDGEKVTSVDSEIGYLHSGFEKQAESMTWEQVTVITDRTNYMSAICNNIGYALAVEELMGIKVPPRCQAVRVILYELGRIQDHIVCNGLAAMDLGAFSVMLWTFIEREKVYDIFEHLTGGRLTLSYTRVGGLARDIPEDFGTYINAFTDKVGQALDEMEKMLYSNQIFIDRTKGIGTLTKEQAISFGLTGPLLRACGVKHDLRKAKPYMGYEQYEFDVPTRPEGDALSRFIVRTEEMRESIKIIQQAMKSLPGGPIFTDDPRVKIPPKEFLKQNLKTPAGMASSYPSIESVIFHFKHYMYGHGMRPPVAEFYSATEAPNGELGYYLVSDGQDKPYRWRVRGPSFYNYASFREQVKDHLISDVVAALSSINVIAGELDR